MIASPFVAGPRIETTDGVEIATYDLGGSGPPLLLAHATGFHGRVWVPVATALGQHYHCWSFDARGHGQSAKAPGGSYEWDGFGRDALAVAKGLGLERPRAAGHSCGGAALLLAEEAEPGTFCALYCYEPVVPIVNGESMESPDHNVMAARARRRREVFSSRPIARDNYAAKPPFSAFDPAALDAYVAWGFDDLADGNVRLSCRGEDEARIYEAAWRSQTFEHLERVACPVALACGGRNAHFGVDLAAPVAARLARHTPVEVHADLGHMGPMERPAEIAASIVHALDTMAVG